MLTEIRIPELAESVEECVLVEWLKKPGQLVAAGEPIVEIETDKATVELESTATGVLVSCDAAEGATLHVGDLVATVSDEAAQTASSPAPAAEGSDQGPAPDANGQRPATAPEEQSSAAKPASDFVKHWRREQNARESAGDRFSADEAQANQVMNACDAAPPIESTAAPAASATPLARRMAAIARIDLSSIPVKSPDGRVRKSDVEAFLQLQQPRVTAIRRDPIARGYRDREPARSVENPRHKISISRVRKLIAQRMADSKRNVPHFYLSIDCCFDPLLRLREQIAGTVTTKPSITVFLIRAAALALAKFPQINAAWSNESIVEFDRIDIAVAVDTEKGLVTPVIRDAGRKGILQTSEDLRDITERARAGKLALEDLTDGTFTISNLGMFGVQSLYAIINPPQSAILGVASSEKRPVMRGDDIVAATMTTFTLSADHRVLDGVAGARYLAAFKEFVEQPLRLLL